MPGETQKHFQISAFGFPRLAALQLCLLASLFLTACQRAPFSSPTALRNTNDYARALSPLPPRALDARALDQFSVTRTGDTLVVTTPSTSGTEDLCDGFAHTVDYLKPGQKLQTPGACFELLALAATGPGLSQPATNRNQPAPLNCFGQDGKQLTPEQLKALGFKKWELAETSIGSSSGVDSSFPSLRVSLGSLKQPPGYCSPVGLFDARTKKSLVSGYSYSQIVANQIGHIYLHPHAWHAAPMDLVLDVELDGKSVVETNIAPGARIPVPGGLVQCLGAWDGDSWSYSSSSGGAPGSPATMRLDLRQQPDQTNVVVLFATEPPQLALHIDLLDARGKSLEPHGGGTTGPIRMAGARARADEVKRARFTVYTNHHRVVLPLPPIPNLPAQNQHLENLFEVTIPQAQIRQEYQLRDLIEESTQFRFVSAGDVLPPAFFPITLTNTTPARLLAEYSRYLTNRVLVVDEQKKEIRVELSRLERIRRWVEQKLGR